MVVGREGDVDNDAVRVFEVDNVAITFHEVPGRILVQVVAVRRGAFEHRGIVFGKVVEEDVDEVLELCRDVGLPVLHILGLPHGVIDKLEVQVGATKTAVESLCEKTS